MVLRSWSHLFSSTGVGLMATERTFWGLTLLLKGPAVVFIWPIIERKGQLPNLASDLEAECPRSVWLFHFGTWSG